VPAKKHDRQALIVSFLEAKGKNHKLSMAEWCSQQGLSRRYMSRIIGRKVVAAWDKIFDKTMEQLEDQLAERLAATSIKMLDANQALFAQGLEQVLTTKKKPKAGLPPADHQDAMNQIRVGGQGYRDTVRMLIGEKPLHHEEAEDPVFRFNEPHRPHRKTGAPKRRKAKRGKRTKPAKA
jgi:hypothetical protein